MHVLAQYAHDPPTLKEQSRFLFKVVLLKKILKNQYMILKFNAKKKVLLNIIEQP